MQILVEAECKAAAVSRNLHYVEEDVLQRNSTQYPTGCFQVYDEVFWNSNKNGKQYYMAKAICKDRSACIIFISFVAN